MVAFEIWGRPIYRYGLFYLTTFVSGYALLRWLGKNKIFDSYAGVQKLFTDGLDDLFLTVILGVMLGGRLGHVFLYEWSYYSQHLSEIYQVWQGGMSFVGGLLGVTIGLIILTKKFRLRWEELLLLGDIVLCVVPLGIFLGRIGNYLNQELRGKPVSEISAACAERLRSLGLTHVYPQVDQLERVNTNLIQSGAEGLIPLIFSHLILWGSYVKKHVRPGLITGCFLIWYGIVRFLVEYWKDLPSHEMRGSLSVTQWVMFGFAGFGIYLLLGALRKKT